jgi:hypothetical protein
MLRKLGIFCLAYHCATRRQKRVYTWDRAVLWIASIHSLHRLVDDRVRYVSIGSRTHLWRSRVRRTGLAKDGSCSVWPFRKKAPQSPPGAKRAMESFVDRR